jgi:broad specificity phosphatase PhoE
MTNPMRFLALLVGLVLALSSCTLLSPATPSAPAGTPSALAEVQWTFTVVRHAERADDGTDNPPLTEAGVARASRLAQRLAGQHGVAVYASTFQRAQSTAKPTAATWGVPVTTYDPSGSVADLTAAVKKDHAGGAILIVGHGDTVPGIVAALCHCAVNPIDDTQFGNLYTVQISTANKILKVVQTLDY